MNAPSMTKLAVLALFLAAHSVASSSLPVLVGEFAACSSTSQPSTSTPFGQGVLALRRTSRALAQCSTSAQPSISTAHLFAKNTGLPKDVPSSHAKYCKLYMDASYWYSLLKVQVPSASSDLSTLHDRVRKYAGEQQPLVLVFPSGDMFIPAPLLSKATVQCGDALEAAEAEPVLPSSQLFDTWGIRPLASLADRRIVSVGDFHGDLQQAKKVLKLARIVDEQGKWNAGNTIFVQTGDNVDRGTDTIEIVEWLDGLIAQAAAAGGQAIILNGNHEIKNVAGDHDDVGAAERNNPTRYKALLDGYDPDPQPAPSPKGRLSRIIYKHDGVAQVGDNVFVHGGITAYWAKKGIQGINSEIRSLLHQYAVDTRPKKKKKSEYEVFGEDGPFYTRIYAEESKKDACPELEKALRALNAKRMIVGHTIQQDNVVHHRCSKQVYLQDVAISGFYDGGHIGATEIRGKQVSALGPNGWTVLDDGGKESADGEQFNWPAVRDLKVIV